MFKRTDALYVHASSADEQGNFDGRVSVDELQAYIGHLEERLARADNRARPILESRLRQTREALDEVSFELGRICYASPH